MVKLRTLSIIKLLFLFTTYLAFSQSSVYDSLNYGGRWRTFMTHLPSGYVASKKYPLVLAFHGGSPLGYQSIQYQSQLSSKADSAGFIVGYPEGVQIAGNRTWNAGGCCNPAVSFNIDDIGFVNSLLNNLFSTRSIDTTRVYATGFSNGALLCYRLANQLTYRFAAIAPVAGDLMYYPWNPSRTIPIIAFHSYKDMNIQYYGGATIGSTGTYFPPQDSILGIIATNYLCQVRKQTLFHDSVKYDHFKYSNCSGNSIIEQYISYDGEHSWPGGLSLSGTSVSQQFNATFLMWEFFKNYKTTGINAVIAEKELSPYSLTLLQNFPNPFNPSTTIRYSLSTPTDVRLSIVDALGREIATLIDAQQSPGEKEVQWNVRDAASGVYFCILRAGNIVVSKKLLLTK